MSTSTLGLFLRHLALSAEAGRLGAASDHQLLATYESGHSQVAFAELMRRYGPMVLRTCRRVLGRGPDAEDAFQATFVLLARKAGSISKRESLGAWLHRVAYRASLDVLTGEIRRRAYERQAGVMTHAELDPAVEATWNEIRPILDAELDALPNEARNLLIACYLQGKTHAEAAAELGLPRGSLARHLERARALLASRLSQHGITVSASLLALALGESARGGGVPAVLLVHTLETATTFTGRSCGMVSANVARLVKSGLSQMAKSWTPLNMVLAGWVGLLGVGLLACQTLKAWPDQTTEGEPPVAAERRQQERDKPTHVDRYGDPLPNETLVRMGTTRLRHEGIVLRVLFAPDGKTVASAGMDGSVRLWDMATGKLLRNLKHPVRDVQPHQVSFIQDGKTLAYTAKNRLWLWDARTDKQLHELKLRPEKNQQITLLAVSSDGEVVASAEEGAGGAAIRLWDVASGNPLRVLDRHGKQVASLCFSPDNQTLASIAYDDKQVHLWDVSSGKLLLTLEHPQQITTVCFAPDGKTLASAGSTKGPQVQPKGDSCVVRLWDSATGKLLHTLEGHQQFITSLSFSPDGKLLVSGGWDRTVRLWDVAAGKELRQLKGHQQLVQALGFSPDGKTLASGGSGAVVRLWDVVTGEELPRLEGMHKGFIRSVSFSPDGRTLTTAAVWKDGDDTIRFWDAASGKLLGRLEHPGGTHAVAFTADGKMLASAGAGALRIWDTTTSKQLHELQSPASQPHIISPGGSPLSLSPDGKLLAEEVNDWTGLESKGTLRLWDIGSGAQLHTLEHPQRAVSAAFSPDGKTLAVGTSVGTLHLWDAVTGKELRNVELEKEQRSWVTPLAFSPDGKTLAAGGYNKKIYLLEMPTTNVVHILTGHSGVVESLAFSSSGRLLASGGTDRTVRLWEVEAGLASQCHLFRGHDAGVTALAFSPDARRLASGSHDSTALIWDVTGQAGKQPRVAKLKQGELTTCWQSLASTDAVRAYQAMRTLARVADQSVPFLSERLQEQIRKKPHPQQIARLLAELDSDDFCVRSKATKELEKWGETVEPALRQALKDNPSLEVRRRIQQLLETMHPDGVSPRLLLWLRVAEVLKWTDTPAARELLKKLATGLPEEDVGQKAKDTLRPSPPTPPAA